MRGPGAVASPAAAHLALLLVQLCFGMFPMFSKWAFAAFPPAAVAFWRVACGAGVLLALAFRYYGRAALPARGDLVRLQLCAVLGVALNQYLFLEGLQRSTAINAGLIIALIPVFTFLFATLVRQEAFAIRRGAGIAIAFTGTMVLGFSSEHLFGNLLMVGNMISYSLYLVLSRALAPRYPPLVMIAWVFGLSVWALPLFAAGGGLVPAGGDSRAWFSIAWIIVFPTVLAYALNIFALGRLGASSVAGYVFLQPLIAGASGVLFLGERLREGTALAACAILGGLGLVVWRRS